MFYLIYWNFGFPTCNGHYYFKVTPHEHDVIIDVPWMYALTCGTCIFSFSCTITFHISHQNFKFPISNGHMLRNFTQHKHDRINMLFSLSSITYSCIFILFIISHFVCLWGFEFGSKHHYNTHLMINSLMCK